MTSPSLTTEDRLAIEALITRFFWCLDNDRIEDVALMFADDAWLDMGVPDRPTVQGPDGVRTMFGVRPEGRVVRHHWLALMPLEIGPDIHASFQFATYVGAKGEPAPPQATTIGDVDARFRRDPETGTWRFANMARTIIFVA